MPRPLGDLGYAFVGWFLLTFVPVAFLLESVAPARSTGPTPLLLAGAVALPAAVAHWYAGRSVGPLGATLFRAAALAVGVGLPVYVFSRWTGVDGWLGSPTARLIGVCFVYAGASALAVRRPGWRGSAARR